MSELAIPDVSAATSVLPAEAALLRRGAAAAGNADQAVKVAKDFESVLLHKLMETMQESVPESGLLDGGMTKQVQGIFWFHMAQEMSRHGGVGLWKDIYTHIGGEGSPQAATMEQQL